MAQIAPIEIRVKREKRDTPQLEQIRDDLTILDPLLLCVKANLTGRNAPSSKELPLAFGDVFIEEVHADTGSRIYSEAVYSGA